MYLRIPIYTDIGPSLQKQSFCVQNVVLQANALQSFACKNSVFASTSFVRLANQRFAASGLQTKGLHEVLQPKIFGFGQPKVLNNLRFWTTLLSFISLVTFL
ncbi:hypothetical protein EON73_00425 [bacterium]|nr:MAG: hypothetical protein EON73_00425 [bacterium]